MAQTPRGGLYGPPSKRHPGVCAIYSETTVKQMSIIIPFPQKRDHTYPSLSHKGPLPVPALPSPPLPPSLTRPVPFLRPKPNVDSSVWGVGANDGDRGGGALRVSLGVRLGRRLLRRSEGRSDLHARHDDVGQHFDAVLLRVVLPWRSVPNGRLHEPGFRVPARNWPGGSVCVRSQNVHAMYEFKRQVPTRAESVTFPSHPIFSAPLSTVSPRSITWHLGRCPRRDSSTCPPAHPPSRPAVPTATAPFRLSEELEETSSPSFVERGTFGTRGVSGVSAWRGRNIAWRHIRGKPGT